MLEERIDAPWRAWETIPVAVAAFLATAIVSFALALGTGGIRGIAYRLTILAFPGAGGVHGPVGSGAVPGRRRPPVAGARGATDVALGALYGLAMFGVTTLAIFPVVRMLWESRHRRSPSPHQPAGGPQGPSAVQVVVAVLAVVVAAPLGEEIFFRGMLFGGLRSRIGFAGAAAVSSAVFALVHVQPPLVVLMFFVGFRLAFVYERRRSLVAPISAHAAFNLVGFSLIMLLR